jgi:nucleoid-associated protein YejK
MKLQYIRVYKNHAILKIEFEKFLQIIKNMPNYKEDFTVCLRNATVETKDYVMNFVVESKEFFMGRKVDYVYFDENSKFDAKVVNEATYRMLRTNNWRENEHYNTKSNKSRSD